MERWLLRPATRHCAGDCGDDSVHDAHLTTGYRLRLLVYRAARACGLL